MEVYLSRGLISSSKVLDIRQVDVSAEGICFRVIQPNQPPYLDHGWKDARERGTGVRGDIRDARSPLFQECQVW